MTLVIDEVVLLVLRAFGVARALGLRRELVPVLLVPLAIRLRLLFGAALGPPLPIQPSNGGMRPVFEEEPAAAPSAKWPSAAMIAGRSPPPLPNRSGRGLVAGELCDGDLGLPRALLATSPLTMHAEHREPGYRSAKAFLVFANGDLREMFGTEILVGRGYRSAAIALSATGSGKL